MVDRKGMKKVSNKDKDFDDEAHHQGGKIIPLPAKKEYGTGLKAKKPTLKIVGKKK